MRGSFISFGMTCVVFALSSATVDCGGERPKAAQAPTHTPALAPAPSASHAAASAPVPCAGQPALFSVSIAAPDATCPEGDLARCVASAPVSFSNCATEAIRIDRVLVIANSDRRRKDITQLEFTEPVVPARATKEHTLKLGPGTYEILTYYSQGDSKSDAGAAMRTVSLEVRIESSELTRAHKACDACGGDFGPFGMLGVVTCNCRTRDGGKVCHDGDDCEGACEYQHAEMVAPEGPLQCDAKGCRRTPAATIPAGRCTDHAHTIGCHTLIPHGQRKTPPSSLPRKLRHVCYD